MKCWIGIDPGQAGGFAVIYESGLWATTAMPSTEREIWNWFDACNKFDPKISQARVKRNQVTYTAIIEKVHSMPKQGVASVFKFGHGYGGLRMALIAVKIPFDEVTPQAWQKGLAIPKRKKTETKTQWKTRLLAKAQQLFPDHSEGEICKKTADALLIAEFHRRKSLGIL